MTLENIILDSLLGDLTFLKLYFFNHSGISWLSLFISSMITGIILCSSKKLESRSSAQRISCFTHSEDNEFFDNKIMNKSVISIVRRISSIIFAPDSNVNSS